VDFKKGVENRVANALFRRDGLTEEIFIALLSIPTSDWVAKLKKHYKDDLLMKELVTKWLTNQLNASKYAYREGLMFYKNRLCLGDDPIIRAQVLSFVHCDPISGHSGYEGKMQMAKRDFFWKGMKRDLKQFITKCEVCQKNKHENTSLAGLVQPLPIPL
jgi:hypothetical protein